MNQGTGMAWNPESCAGDPWDPLDPPWCGSCFLDFFTVPVLSYPYQRYGFTYTNVAAIYPGAVHTIVFTYDGFSEQELAAIHRFYVKVDNYVYPYGLVPEFNEMNNLGEVIYPIYLPRIVRNWLP